MTTSRIVDAIYLKSAIRKFTSCTLLLRNRFLFQEMKYFISCCKNRSQHAQLQMIALSQKVNYTVRHCSIKIDNSESIKLCFI
jgi:hypothetical protein